MWRRLLLIDVMLSVVFIYGLSRVWQTWNEFEIGHRVDKVEAEKESVKVFPSVNTSRAASEDWTEISIKNPFSFDRNDVAVVAPKPEAPALLKPILFGTMAIGGEWIAMLSPNQGATRTSRPVKVGEAIGGWQVLEIHEKSVVVTEESGVRQTIALSDVTAQIPRDYGSRTLAVMGAPPSAVTVTTPAAAPPSPQPQPLNSAAPPAPQPAQGAPGPRTKVVHTPFGDNIVTIPEP